MENHRGNKLVKILGLSGVGSGHVVGGSLQSFSLTAHEAGLTHTGGISVLAWVLV